MRNLTVRLVEMPLLADLLQDLAGGMPGDSLESQQAHGEPLRQQTLQGAVQVLWEEKGESLEVKSTSSR